MTNLNLDFLSQIKVKNNIPEQAKIQYVLVEKETLLINFSWFDSRESVPCQATKTRIVKVKAKINITGVLL